MNPDTIKLENLSKIFEYEKISRELDSCENLEQLRDIAKCYVKLHFKQQETISALGIL